MSALPLADGRAGLVWLDGRQQGGGQGYPHVVAVSDRALVAWVGPGPAVPIRTAAVGL